jgi:hypothetical protein
MRLARPLADRHSHSTLAFVCCAHPFGARSRFDVDVRPPSRFRHLDVKIGPDRLTGRGNQS